MSRGNTVGGWRLRNRLKQRCPHCGAVICLVQATDKESPPRDTPMVYVTVPARDPTVPLMDVRGPVHPCPVVPENAVPYVWASQLYSRLYLYVPHETPADEEEGKELSTEVTKTEGTKSTVESDRTQAQPIQEKHEIQSHHDAHRWQGEQRVRRYA